MKKFWCLLGLAVSFTMCILYAEYIKRERKKFGEDLERDMQSDFELLDEIL